MAISLTLKSGIENDPGDPYICEYTDKLKLVRYGLRHLIGDGRRHSILIIYRDQAVRPLCESVLGHSDKKGGLKGDTELTGVRSYYEGPLRLTFVPENPLPSPEK